MSERSERIRKLITESGKTYQELEKLTGIKKSSLQRYASGVTEKIPLSAIEKLADAFCVPAAYIMGWEKDGPEEQAAFDAKVLADKDVMDMLRDYYSLSEEQKKAVRQMVKALTTA